MEKNAMDFGNVADERQVELIEDGTYEVTLSLEKRIGKTSGKPYLNAAYTIKENANQKFKGRKVFEAITQDKTNSLWYDLIKLKKLIKTQPNPKLLFEDVDECILYLNGISLRIDIEKIFDENRQVEVNKVVDWSYKPSSIQKSNTESLEMSDNDLPF